MGQVVESFLQHCIVFVLAYTMKSLGYFDQDDGARAVRLVVNFLVPMTLIVNVPHIVFKPEWLMLPALSLIYLAVTAPFFRMVFARLHPNLKRSERGQLQVCCVGQAVTLVGYPVLHGFFGSEGLSRAAMFDLGNMLCAYMATYAFSCIYAPKHDHKFETMRCGSDAAGSSSLANSGVNGFVTNDPEDLDREAGDPHQASTPRTRRMSTFQDIAEVFETLGDDNDAIGQVQDPMLPTPAGRRATQAQWWKSLSKTRSMNDLQAQDNFGSPAPCLNRWSNSDPNVFSASAVDDSFKRNCSTTMPNPGDCPTTHATSSSSYNSASGFPNRTLEGSAASPERITQGSRSKGWKKARAILRVMFRILKLPPTLGFLTGLSMKIIGVSTLNLPSCLNTVCTSSANCCNVLAIFALGIFLQPELLLNKAYLSRLCSLLFFKFGLALIVGFSVHFAFQDRFPLVATTAAVCLSMPVPPVVIAYSVEMKYDTAFAALAVNATLILSFFISFFLVIIMGPTDLPSTTTLAPPDIVTEQLQTF